VCIYGRCLIKILNYADQYRKGSRGRDRMIFGFSFVYEFINLTLYIYIYLLWNYPFTKTGHLTVNILIRKLLTCINNICAIQESLDRYGQNLQQVLGVSKQVHHIWFDFIYIYIFIMKLPLYIGGANRRGVGGASNFSY
jgi:hypothetical protein